jgi:phospholipase/carboxylesterase
MTPSGRVTLVKMTRRHFGVNSSLAVLGATLSDGCVVATKPAEAREDARLTARPRSGIATSATSGALGLARGRDAILHLPAKTPDGPLPLIVFLHGATQAGAGMLRRVGPIADETSVAVLAPDSRDGTWDAIRGTFGDDVAFLDRALEWVFARVAVDPSRVAVGGFSDGASYAISLALANGDLFPRVAAFSPGFVIPAPTHGRPRFFISHGTSDQILPIDRCSRVIVPRLRSRGYDVTFREFEGRHEMPPDVLREGFTSIAAARD